MDEQAFRPQWQFKFQAHFDKWFGLPQCLKTYHLSLYNIKKDMLLTGPFAMLSMPSFDFHLPPCTEGFFIHLSPLWQLPLWQLPLFPSVTQFPCVPKGGHLSFFSLFLSLLFCLKIFFLYCRSSCRRSGYIYILVRSIFQHACFSLRNKGHIIVMIFIRTHWFLTRGLMPSWMFREIP